MLPAGAVCCDCAPSLHVAGKVFGLSMKQHCLRTRGRGLCYVILEWPSSWQAQSVGMLLVRAIAWYTLLHDVWLGWVCTHLVPKAYHSHPTLWVIAGFAGFLPRGVVQGVAGGSCPKKRCKNKQRAEHNQNVCMLFGIYAGIIIIVELNA